MRTKVNNNHWRLMFAVNSHPRCETSKATRKPKSDRPSEGWKSQLGSNHNLVPTKKYTEKYLSLTRSKYQVFRRIYFGRKKLRQTQDGEFSTEFNLIRMKNYPKSIRFHPTSIKICVFLIKMNKDVPWSLTSETAPSVLQSTCPSSSSSETFSWAVWRRPLCIPF